MQRSELTLVVRGAGRRIRLTAMCLVLPLAVCGTAYAQSNPRQLADANKSAMEQYNNLDIESAKAGLDKAIKNAEKNGIRGPALARTYSNLAVVLVGGLGDQKAAASAFAKALAEDPKVEPDPIVATPEVMQAFAAAKKGGGQDEGAPRRRSTAAPEGNLDHTPVAEQLSQTAVPVFVAKATDLDIDKVKIAYRSTGMAKPRSATMNETDDGYTFLIPCTDVFEPDVEYFLTAVDSSGNTVGNYGNAEAPVSVPIVSTRTQDAPSLPGEAPPSQCASSAGDNECPPGMPGCVQHGDGGLGDTCSADSDCGAGMICEDDFCSMGERASSDDDSSSSSKKRLKRKLFLDIGVGVALTVVTKGRGADRNVTPALLTSVAERSRGADGAINVGTASTLLAAQGWDCDLERSADNRQLTSNGCSVAVNPGGVVPVPVINIATGYFITPSFALALTGRFQIGRGEGPLAGITVGGRGELYLTKPADQGLKVGLLGGLSIGQMQARPPADGSKQGPFATNANVGGVGVVINAGMRVVYMFTPDLGLNLTPMLNFGVPNFLFSPDLVAGVTAQF